MELIRVKVMNEILAAELLVACMSADNAAFAAGMPAAAPTA
jgi:hypothetical protein